MKQNQLPSPYFFSSMNVRILLLFFLFAVSTQLFAQNQNVGIGTETPDDSAILDMVSTDQGVLVPRLSTAQRLAISNPGLGLLLYDTDEEAFFFHSGTAWVEIIREGTETDPKVGNLGTGKIPFWNGTTLQDGLISDNGTDLISASANMNLIGSVGINGSHETEMPLTLNANGSDWMKWNGPNNSWDISANDNGQDFLISEFGVDTRLALKAGGKIGIGTVDPGAKLEVTEDILVNGLTLGRGSGSLFQNTAIGLDALLANTLGVENTAVGMSSLQFNTTGGQNTAVGLGALALNVDASHNTALGYTALGSTTGGSNTAIGSAALVDLTTGSDNVAVGAFSMPGLGTGYGNTAIGRESGFLATGDRNVFLGYRAGYNETGSDKLYIANSATSDPLIYGDFDNSLVRVNGSLNINNAYSFPLTAGGIDQIMVADGSGNTSWQTLNVEDADHDPGNEFNTNAQLSGNTLQITDGGGTKSVDLSSLVGSGHWSASGNTIYNNNSGNVGIGTSSTNAKLTVAGSVNANNLFIDGSNDNRKIEHISSCMSSGASFMYVDFWGCPYEFNFLDFRRGSFGSQFRVTQSGNVYADGKVTCKEVEVKSNIWADYVFEEGYELMPLKKVEEFIAQHGHLPNVPSATDIMEKGLELGEMNRILMEKIEELTLHAIDKEKKIDQLEEKLARIESLLEK